MTALSRVVCGGLVGVLGMAVGEWVPKADLISGSLANSSCASTRRAVLWAVSSESRVRKRSTSMARGSSSTVPTPVAATASRFCSLCNTSASRVVRRQTTGKSSTSTHELQDIVQFLNQAQIRATYGAVAELVGGISRGIGARLTQLYARSPEASWVVSADSGLPTGYDVSETHPALLTKRGVITSGPELDSGWRVG